MEDILSTMRHCRDILTSNGFGTEAVTLNNKMHELKDLQDLLKKAESGDNLQVLANYRAIRRRTT